MILFPWMYRVLIGAYAILGILGIVLCAARSDAHYLAVTFLGLIGVGFNWSCISYAKEYWAMRKRSI